MLRVTPIPGFFSLPIPEGCWIPPEFLVGFEGPLIYASVSVKSNELPLLPARSPLPTRAY